MYGGGEFYGDAHIPVKHGVIDRYLHQNTEFDGLKCVGSRVLLKKNAAKCSSEISVMRAYASRYVLCVVCVPRVVCVARVRHVCCVLYVCATCVVCRVSRVVCRVSCVVRAPRGRPPAGAGGGAVGADGRVCRADLPRRCASSSSSSVLYVQRTSMLDYI